jgi:ribosome-associated toxin RatA of RatAB toxin-antitoxin module
MPAIAPPPRLAAALRAGRFYAACPQIRLGAAMKQLFGSAVATTPASLERCFQLVAAIDRYPIWYPAAVTAAEVTERDVGGLPTRARVNLHVSQGVLVRDFRLNVDVVTRELESVQMSRIPRGPDDREELTVAWTLAGGDATQIEVRMSANLSIPRFVPVSGIAESMARGFLDAALDALR